MYIQKLKLTQFKNHEKSEFEFCEGLNCFYGKNGVGKTNVLDALHYLCNGKSYFGRVDANNIQFDTDFALIEAEIINEGEDETVSVGLQVNGKKGLKKNGSVVKRLADYVGYMPGVMITPGDITMLTGHSDERRKFIDKAIGYTDKAYLTFLIKYNKLLESRNELLKQFYIQQRQDLLAIEAIDNQLIPLMNLLHEKRATFIEELITPLNTVYKQIVNDEESLSLKLDSELIHHDAATILKMSLNKDLLAQRTTKGVHKDDLEVEINHISVKKFGSQGQIKSATIALQLASYLYMKSILNKRPLLLLDDVFEKIDDMRSARLLKLISTEDFGQIFITDTSESRMKSKLKEVATEKKFFNIESNFTSATQ